MTYIQKNPCYIAFIFLSYLSLLPTYILAQGAGKALQLDGYDDFALFNNHNRGIINQLTVEAWIKTNSMGHHHIVSKYDRDSENGFQLLIQNGKACIAGRDGSGNYRLSGYSPVIVADNNWHHLAGVVQDGTWSIYVDGILQNQQVTGYTNVVLNNNENLLLGNYYYAYLGNHFYKGLMDEVRIWNVALSEEEIRKNMCRTLPADAPNLVAYFRFDEANAHTVKDQSIYGMDGTIQNMNPSIARVTSGAPIGDKSVYRYTANWDESLEMLTDLATFSVNQVDPATKGFHLYSIQTPPASRNGIDSPHEVKEYFGLFKVGAINEKYKVYYQQHEKDCSGNLYRRQDNTSFSWNLVADTTSSPIVVYNSSANYGEFSATGKAAPPLKIIGPAAVCAGSTATLYISDQSTGEILWNTGETSSTINITKGGKYSVEVTTAGGCITKDEIEVIFLDQPLTSLPSEAFICYSEPVVIDATTAGAAYSWSTGQTTPSIMVTKPGVYAVTLTLNDCNYIKEIVVSNDECPTIPNIITPNGDGKNDAFVVQGVEQNTLGLKVFNRWGKQVYIADSYDNGWQAADVPAGIYYYQLTSSRTQKLYKGWLEVIK